MQEMQGPSLGWEDPLEKEMATPSSILAWRIPWTEESGEAPVHEISKVSESVQSLSHVRLFATPWTAAHQTSLSITSSHSLLKPMSIESVMPSNHLILCCPLPSHLQFFPASGSFPMSQLFTSGGQSIRVSASASVLPMNIQD